MDTKSILKDAMRLRPSERLQLMEMLAKSLNKPDEDIEKIWADESEKRYTALRKGKLRTFSLKEVIERYK